MKQPSSSLEKYPKKRKKKKEGTSTSHNKGSTMEIQLVH